MAQDRKDVVEMQDKPDGCLSAVDEEREPCLKESTDKNNGTAVVLPAGDKKPENNNTAASTNGKFHAFAAVTSLEQKLRDKTGFSRTGLILVLAALFLCLVLIVTQLFMLIMWPRTQPPLLVCKTTSCLRASAEVLPKINFTQPPCEHFRDYACGGWLQTNSLPGYMSTWSLKNRIQQEQKVMIRNMVVTLRNVASSNSLNWKMKHFYESCMNLDNIEMDEGKPLKKIISTKLGGWSVLKDFDFNQWDKDFTMVQLHSKYSVDLFFKINVVPDDRAAGKYIIQISPSGLGLPDRRYYVRSPQDKIVIAYKQYMVDVSQLLGATSSDATSFSEEIFNYEKRIAEITPPGKQEDLLASHQRFTVARIKDFASLVPLLHILQSKFPENNINDDTHISVVSPTYFSNLSNLISSSDRNGLNNYFMWKMADAFVPYLSVKFREVVKIYTAELIGEKDSPPRWETCVSLLQRFMGFGVSASMEPQIENKDSVVAVVNDLFYNIKDTIRSYVDSNEHLEPELRNHVLSKLNNLTVQVGLPNDMLKESFVNQFYSQLQIQKLDLFLNINSAISFTQDYSQVKLKATNEEHHGWLDDLVSENPKVTYNMANNKVIVPMALLARPYFEIGYPEAMLYGGLGVELSSAILSSVYPPGVAYGIDGVLLPAHSAAVNLSAAATTEARKCHGQMLYELRDQKFEITNNTALTAMLSVSSVRFALQSLTKKIQSAPHYRQPAMESYEYDTLFFITYAQSLCAIKSRQLQELDTMFDMMSDESLLLRTIADHSEAFNNAFKCPGKITKTCKYIY